MIVCASARVALPRLFLCAQPEATPRGEKGEKNCTVLAGDEMISREDDVRDNGFCDKYFLSQCQTFRHTSHNIRD